MKNDFVKRGKELLTLFTIILIGVGIFTTRVWSMEGKMVSDDNEPPEIFVSIPPFVYVGTLEIIGKVNDEMSGVKILSINDTEIKFSPDGSFSYKCNLKPLKNKISFYTEDFSGNNSIHNFEVFYLLSVILKLQIGNRIMLVNDKVVDIDVPPTIIEGRTLLPIRWIAEPLGADVSWDGTERKVTVTLNDTTIELWIGKSIARVNDNYQFIDPDNPNVRPLIIKGRTMIPVRFVAENFGCKVDWDGATRTVIIIYKEEP